MPQYRNLKGKNIADMVNEPIFAPSNVGLDIYAVYPDIQINDSEKEIVNNAAVVAVDVNGIILWEVGTLKEWKNTGQAYELYRSFLQKATFSLQGHPFDGKKMSEIMAISLHARKSEAEAIAIAAGFTKP